MKPTILHVLAKLSRGGPMRGLIGAVSADGNGFCHRVLSLEPAEASGADAVRTAGLELIDAPLQSALHAELTKADIVHAYFWNSPELYALLTGPLPPLRLLASCRVAGDSPPQVLIQELIAFTDLIVASTPYTEELGVFREAPSERKAVIRASGGWDRVRHVKPKPHSGLNVGYIGHVEFTKMHPRYVAMSARVRAEDTRFIVCGSGGAFEALARESVKLGARKRFDFRGYVEDIGSVLEELDVFGYPLREGNYSATDLVLQEAMYCSVPPVVMAHGGAQASVINGRTGLVVDNEDAYVAAIERLHADPEERRRLGRAAAEHARATWDLETIGRQWQETYLRLMAEPKRARSWPTPALLQTRPNARGAAGFVQAIGDTAPEFTTSLLGTDVDELLAAEREIARCTPLLGSADGGGVVHWRRRYPTDPWLRLWSGLVFHGQGRLALAIGEFHGAIEHGLDDWRARSYLARSAGLLGNRELLERTLGELPRDEAHRARQLIGAST